jgi:hypothetical protein
VWHTIGILLGGALINTMVSKNKGIMCMSHFIV